MTKVFIGYILWSLKTNAPHGGKRRFKVWTTEREARAGWPDDEQMRRYHLEVRKVYVEV